MTAGSENNVTNLTESLKRSVTISELSGKGVAIMFCEVGNRASFPRDKVFFVVRPGHWRK